MGICSSKNDYLESLTISQKTLSILEKNICNIRLENGTIQTGFFCSIPFLSQSKLIPVLVINDYILDMSDTKMSKTIRINYSDINNIKIEKTINLDAQRMIFSDKDMKITLIELLPNIDGINLSNFLEIDENIFQNNNDIYKDQPIYILGYQNDQEVSYLVGTLEEINDKKIKYNSSTDNPSNSGLPILLLSNNKIIGINNKINEGYFIKFFIEEINKVPNSNLSIKNNLNKNNINIIEMII